MQNVEVTDDTRRLIFQEIRYFGVWLHAGSLGIRIPIVEYGTYVSAGPLTKLLSISPMKIYKQLVLNKEDKRERQATKEIDSGSHGR